MKPYQLETNWHINRCLTVVNNPRLFKAYLRYAMYDLGLDSQ